MERFCNLFKRKKNKQKEVIVEQNINNLISYGVHGIREPLHACVYIIDELKKELEKEKDNIRIMYMQRNIIKLDSLINHTNDVTNNFFDMYKLKNTEIFIKLKPVNVIDIIKEVYTLFKIFESEEIKYTINPSKIDKKIINVDEHKLRQILNNVYDNSKEATKKGEINIKYYCKNNKFFIELTDTGEGIDDSIDYFNLNENGKFGLHVTKFLAMKMMGGVEIHNRKDNIKGTVFKCWFYDIEEEDENENENENEGENENNPEEEKLFSDKKIVYVEDDYINNNITGTMLLKIGFKKDNIYSFYDGEEYIEYIEKNKSFNPDILLLDIVLVKLNGDKLCKILRDRGYKIPILAATGNLLNSKVIEKYRKVGFTDIMNKPYSMEEIKNILKNNLI